MVHFLCLFCFILSAFRIDWTAEAVPKAEVLRLIYQGRFLHCNVTLGALVLPLGKTTVMHLVPRDNLPEPNSQGNFICEIEHVYSYSSSHRASFHFKHDSYVQNDSEI